MAEKKEDPLPAHLECLDGQDDTADDCVQSEYAKDSVIDVLVSEMSMVASSSGRK